LPRRRRWAVCLIGSPVRTVWLGAPWCDKFCATHMRHPAKRPGWRRRCWMSGAMLLICQTPREGLLGNLDPRSRTSGEPDSQ
jgi:hypothetical protein